MLVAVNRAHQPHLVTVDALVIQKSGRCLTVPIQGKLCTNVTRCAEVFGFLPGSA